MAHATSRRGVLAALAAGLAGCGANRGEPTASGPANPALGPVTSTGGLEVTSPAFGAGEAIPRKYGRARRNVNPPLVLTGVPVDARSLALIMDDPDAPGGTFLHWLVWNVPPDTRRIPERWTPQAAVEGSNGFGNRGYDGPAPPSGTHGYRFKCYALARRLDLPADADREAVGEAMAGDVLAADQLVGTYSAEG